MILFDNASNGTRVIVPASTHRRSFSFMRAGMCYRVARPAWKLRNRIGSRRISLRVAVPSLRRSRDRGSPLRSSTATKLRPRRHGSGHRTVSVVLCSVCAVLATKQACRRQHPKPARRRIEQQSISPMVYFEAFAEQVPQLLNNY